MLNALNMLYMGVMFVSSIVLYSDADYKFPAEMDAVVEVSTHREWWRADGSGKCNYTGVLVPFSRDWDEVDDSTYPPTVREATPNKREGHIIVINKQVCGDEVTPVLRAGPVHRTYGDFRRKHQVVAQDVTAMSDDNKPKWLGQVLERIERVAQTDKAAASFVAYVAASAESLAANAGAASDSKEAPAAAAKPRRIQTQSQDDWMYQN